MIVDGEGTSFYLKNVLECLEEADHDRGEALRQLLRTAKDAAWTSSRISEETLQDLTLAFFDPKKKTNIAKDNDEAVRLVKSVADYMLEKSKYFKNKPMDFLRC